MKQNGAVLAKGWLLGLQFCALLEDDTYEKMTARADAYAMEIKAAFKEKGIPEFVDSLYKPAVRDRDGRTGREGWRRSIPLSRSGPWTMEEGSYGSAQAGPLQKRRRIS